MFQKKFETKTFWNAFKPVFRVLWEYTNSYPCMTPSEDSHNGIAYFWKVWWHLVHRKCLKMLKKWHVCVRTLPFSAIFVRFSITFMEWNDPETSHKCIGVCRCEVNTSTGRDRVLVLHVFDMFMSLFLCFCVFLFGKTKN